MNKHLFTVDPATCRPIKGSFSHATVVPCSGVGDLSVWEFSGNECYYVCYDHFIGDPNCIHCVVFRLSDSPQVQRQQIHFWLNFIRARISPTEPIGACCIFIALLRHIT